MEVLRPRYAFLPSQRALVCFTTAAVLVLVLNFCYAGCRISISILHPFTQLQLTSKIFFISQLPAQPLKTETLRALTSSRIIMHFD